MSRTVSFSFSRNTSPGDVTQSMQLVITDAANNVVVSLNCAASTTSQTAILPAGTGYTAKLTAYSGGGNTGLPCTTPAVRVFDVPALPPPPTPGNPTLDVPVIS